MAWQMSAMMCERHLRRVSPSRRATLSFSVMQSPISAMNWSTLMP